MTSALQDHPRKRTTRTHARLRSIAHRCLAIVGVGAAGLFVAASLPAPPAQADTNDFSYESWHAEYQLSLDDEGRAQTRVTETLVAQFPDVDQNRGLVRGIPIDYQGASTNPRDFSVTDGNGEPVPFEIEEDDGFVAFLTGDDSYVHGTQTYVLEYTLSDTVLARDDGAADEFYWDVLDVEHAQPIEAFSATFSFAPELAEALAGTSKCYVGAAQATSNCELSFDASSATYLLAPRPMGPHEGVTVAIALDPGTVTQPGSRVPNFTLDTLPLFLAGLTTATGIAGTVAVARLRSSRKQARGVVVAQYDVPAHLPPLIAAPIVGASASPVPAEFVHLAVNQVLRIEEGEPEQGFFGPKTPQPAMRLLDPARAGDALDTATLQDLFPGGAPGALVEIPKEDEKFGKRMTALQAEGASQASSRGYFEKVASPVGRALGLASLGLGAVLLVFVILGITSRNSITPVIGLFAVVLAVILGLVGLVKHRVHTPLGAETREYLEGVKEFIRVAEADRLQMLQSVDGAERRQDGTLNVIDLYEKLLPYAMIFGLEKQWSSTLETKYAEQSGYVPIWYPAMAVHGISSFTSTISTFTSSLSSSVSYTSSSSGGSSGGGFVGGGGGGGFSGGR